MNFIYKHPNEDGSYSPIQNSNTLPEECAIVPDSVDVTDFYEYNGFVVLTIEQVEGVDTVTAYIPNVEAWEAWKASLPEPEPEQPTEEEDTAAMLVDHEYRLTMLELFSDMSI